MRLEVYPTFSVYVYLQEFCAVELIHGYYQVRITFKSTPLFDCQLSRCFTLNSDDSSLVENLTGISRVAKIAFKEQFCNLDCAFKCRANATRRIDCKETTYNLPVQVELYYLDPEFSSYTTKDFRLVSKREVEIRLRVDKSIHCHRPIIFEFFSFSMVSVTIHASLIAGRIVCKKLSTDSAPPTQKLRQLHSCVCQRLISSLSSLQEFMQNFSYFLTSPLQIKVINKIEEETRLQKELETAENPWKKFEKHVQYLNHCVSAVFNQFLQLFARSKELCEFLLQDLDRQRFKQFAEGFWFTEHTVASLLDQKLTETPTIIELMRKADYLKHIPPLSVYVANLDLNTNYATIIVEHRFLSTLKKKKVPFAERSIEETIRKLCKNVPKKNVAKKNSAAAISQLENLNKKNNEEKNVLLKASSGQILPTNLELIQNIKLKQQRKSLPIVSANSEKINQQKKLFHTRSIFEFCLPLGRQNNFEKNDQYGENVLELDSDVVQKTSDNSPDYEQKKNQRRMTDVGLPTDSAFQFSSNLEDKPCHSKSLEKTKFVTSNKCSFNKEIGCSNEDDTNNKLNLSNADLSEDSTSDSDSELLHPSLENLKYEFSQIESTASKLRTKVVEDAIIEFTKHKEYFKLQLQYLGFHGTLYSDVEKKNSNLYPFFSNLMKKAIERRLFNDVNLIVFVHGLEGTSEDLTTYRNYLKIVLPDQNLEFLMSECNQNETWFNVERMAQNLYNEITEFIRQMPIAPIKISFVAHSLGGIIIRAMCGLESIKTIVSKFHTLMTLNSPHCGLMYNPRTASWGISLLQWWKQSPCLDQLTFRDSSKIRETFMYKLSQNGAFSMFKNILLIGSNQDYYVPGHSALIEHCKASVDNSETATVYSEMLKNINESIVNSKRKTSVIKYTVVHALANVSRAQQVTGRAVHIAAVDDDTFVEKLTSISAEKYFR